ncbi:MAG: sensor histidine kinase [Flavobacteriales bacterium]
MAIKSPRAIALRTALSIAVIGAIFYFIIESFLDHFPVVLKTIILLVTISIAAFFVVNFSLEKFLNNKVKLIYKTINNFRRGGDQSKLKIEMGTDVLSEVNSDVQAWSKDKLGRIEFLQNQENFRKEFIGNLAHELKTPVFSIQGYILTLLDGALDDPEHNEIFLKKAAKSVDRITSLLGDLDNISSLEEGAIPLEKTNFDIIALTKEVFEMLESTAQSEGVTLRLKAPNQKSEMVCADRGKIMQVLTNLIVNSIKYSSTEGYTEVRYYDMDDTILIEVKDNGMGIDEKHLPRLFERFYRVDKSRSRHIGGTGLGLAISKHIIEAHGHEISVRSKVDKGSTFSFSLIKP